MNALTLGDSAVPIAIGSEQEDGEEELDAANDWVERTKGVLWTMPISKQGESRDYWAKFRPWFQILKHLLPATKFSRRKILKRFLRLKVQYPEAEKLLSGILDTGVRNLDVVLKQLNGSIHEFQFMGVYSMKFLLTSALEEQRVIRRFLTRYPSTLDIPIRKPIVIAGLHRTGSSFLQNLLALDPNALTPTWENLHGDPLSKRVAIERSPANELAKISPIAAHRLQQLHPVEVDKPEEDTILGFYALSPVADAWHFLTDDPNSAATKLFLTDLQLRRAGYRYLKVFCQIWSSPENKFVRDNLAERHWVLKNPYHSLCLRTMLETFPDADIILTHRDITSVVKSYTQILCLLAALWLKSKYFNARRTALHVLRAEITLANRLVRYQSLAEKGKVPKPFNITHKEIMTSPVETVRKIYEFFDRPFTRTYEGILSEYVAKNPPTPSHRKKSLQLIGLNESDLQLVPEIETYHQTFLR